MWLVPLVDATSAACGGKARGLARLIAAGLPVPGGWVLDDRAFAAAAAGDDADEDGGGGGGDGGGLALDDVGHAVGAIAARLEARALPDALIAEVDAAARGLGRVAVRSSAAIEDGEAAAAPGVFVSQVAVRAEDVWPAIRQVWASALAPLAVAYARRRGARGAPAIAVILQRFVEGERATVYTRPPGAPAGGELWIQRAGAIAKRARDDDDDDPIARLALAAERAIGAAGGADVELVIAPDAIWIVQARPIVHPAPRPTRPPVPDALLAPLLADGRRWTWDVAHNPDPLSPAQASLVERVERAAIAPWSMRVCAGYLYTAARDAPAPPPAPRDALDDTLAAIAPRIEAALGPDDPDAAAPALDDALRRYLAFYAIWAREVAPVVAAARAAAPAPAHRGARPSALDTALLEAAAGRLAAADVIARFGALAPAWDVAAPTFGEQPALVHAAIARLRARSGDAPAPPPAGARDPAADLGELDDLWFARAQRLVRRAILARARAAGVPDEDACWLPLDAWDAPDLDPITAQRRAAGARSAVARAARWAMPLVVGGAAPTSPSTRSSLPGRGLHGMGFGGRVTGTVRKLASLASAAAPLTGSSVGPLDVVVVRAVTPALAVFVAGGAALVSETGGLLDHGAALARELGIACVVGCADAWSLLDDGARVTVDGDAGTVVLEEG